MKRAYKEFFNKMNKKIDINSTLLWTLIKGLPCYVLNHEKGKIKVIEISENFVIGEEFDKQEDYWEKYHAIPKNRIISMEAFTYFQEDSEDLNSHIKEMFNKIFR